MDSSVFLGGSVIAAVVAGTIALFAPCLRRTPSGTSLAPGLLLAVMGAATVAIAMQGEAMPATSGWQLTDIEARWADFQSAGVDRVVSVTTDPLDALEQKVELEGISSPVLSDRGLVVSWEYDTNSYGRMAGRTAATASSSWVPTARSSGAGTTAEPFSYGGLSERKLRRELHRRLRA